MKMFLLKIDINLMGLLWFVFNTCIYLEKVDYAELPLVTPLSNKKDFSKTYRRSVETY